MTRPRRFRRERGIALLMVMGITAVAGLLVAHVVVTGEAGARDSLVAEHRARLRYAAESAAQRALWLLLTDRSQQADRSLALARQPEDGEPEERWMADGAPHAVTANGVRVDVVVEDADAGYDVSGPGGVELLQSLLSQEGEALPEIVQRFFDGLLDYVDTDDSARLFGKESGEYGAEGLSLFPRNNVLQFREELFWIDGVGEAVARLGQTDGEGLGDVFRVVPPDAGPGAPGRRGGRGGRPSIMTATAAQLRLLSGASDAEVDVVEEAKRRWREERTPFNESIILGGLLPRLQSSFSFVESGVVRVRAVAYSADGTVQRSVSTVRDCRGGVASAADPQGRLLMVWESRVR